MTFTQCLKITKNDTIWLSAKKFTLQAKFLELDGHPLEARVDVVAEKKPSAKV